MATLWDFIRYALPLLGDPFRRVARAFLQTQALVPPPDVAKMLEENHKSFLARWRDRWGQG